MSIRSAFASALQFLRAHRKLSQKDIATQTDQSHISRLEAGERSVSLEVSQELAEALGLDPMTLLTIVYAAELGQSPREILRRIYDDLESSNLLDAKIPSSPTQTVHPVVAEASELKRKIIELMDEGHSQAEVARRLEVSKSTVTRHLKKSRHS
ncbi:helix-turn-helix domain-containing protein [Pseudomonas sp. TH03]|uniref:helix-turn-helix domain-containing protein n=1 Tax=Pseudomonas sp. TH03 TaxID=2796369 RepID=UPI001912E649|nr:helix-turn-helix domain-containing protein [Pseudomonas sp. TH03]MBK5552147.1 helix-turn-helix domain-containing protein [Pseudomonas sp. TH03]